MARTHASSPAHVAARANGTAYEIDLFGAIGGYEGVSAQQFKDLLEDAGNPSSIVVNLNSPGGDVFDGIAIHNLLASHGASIEVRVMGLAASAASVIAMAGDSILMGEGSFIMIHNAWTIAVGDTREMAKMGRTLAGIDRELAKTYAARTGEGVAEIKDMMDAETWMGADDAIELGFADGTFEAPPEAKNSFDLSRFKNVPKALVVKGSKRSAKDHNRRALPTPVAENLSPLRAALERLNLSMCTPS